MAFFRRSAAILRSALPGLQLREQSVDLLLKQPHGQSVLRPFSPCFGARLMCSVPSTKLFVGGLAWGMDENALREAFVEYGEVVEAKVVLDRDSGRSRGFGFVSFTCTDHAESAKNGLDGKTLNGRTLRVNFAIEKQRGFGSFGAYGGGGFGSGDSGSSYGNPSFDSGAAANDSSNQGNEYFSNNTFNQESLNSVGNNNSDNSSGVKDDFFGDDAFDDGGDDAFGKDGDLAQGYK